MALFSQRMGFKPASKSIQRESLDEETRNGLWTCLFDVYGFWNFEGVHEITYPYRRPLEVLFGQYWTQFFKSARDTLPEVNVLLQRCRDFFFKTSWFGAYDFLDFTLQNFPFPKMRDEFIASVNHVLEQESCAYRVISGVLVENFSKPEAEAVDEGMVAAHPDSAVHIEKALRLLADRKQPDYHNSIKESVSAIEAAARRALADPSIVLSDALKKFGATGDYHPALIKTLSSLYAYAGDEGGVRHANKATGRAVTQAEARFILVIAASSSNFIATKSSPIK